MKRSRARVFAMVLPLTACSSNGATSSSGATGAGGAPTTSSAAPSASGAGGAVVDAGPDADATGDGAVPSSCGVPFSPTGPWCYPLPASTPTDPNSAAIVANIQTDIAQNYGTFAINTDTYSSPLYTVPSGAPTTHWTFDDCQKKGSVPPSFAAVLQGVPTLAGMVASMGTDQEITLYEPSADQEWEFWVAGQEGGAWSACWGGTIQHVSANPGIFPAGLGATASGLPLLGFVVRIAELQAGLIQHAINIEVVRTQAGAFSWPANRTDGNTPGADILMEGQRVRLDPTFDVSTLPNAAERTLAKAMQDYGMILSDTAGAVVLQAEDPRPYMAAHGTTTNPYDAIFGGRAAYAVLQELPLSRLQVLPKDYGQSFMH